MRLLVLFLLAGWGAPSVVSGPAFQDPAAGPSPARREGGLDELVRSSWWMRRSLGVPWVLRGANVVDVRTGGVREGVDVIVEADLIRSIGVPAPEKMPGFDATGKYVIPGLFDLHAHVLPVSRRFGQSKPPEETLADLLHAGVTTIRLLPLTGEAALLWAARIHAGELIGPTVIPSGGLFEKEPQRSSRGFGDPATAASWVRKEALLGARWIKVYSSMDEPSLRAIVDTAHALGLRVGGHATGVPPFESVTIGQDTLEHTIDWPASCQRDGRQAEVRGMIQRAAENWADYDADKGTVLMELMRSRGAAWVPTLAISERVVQVGGHDGREVEDEDVLAAFDAGLSTAAREAVRMHRMGGLVGLGTDFPVDGVVPGTSAHRELELFVERGGATPLEALQIGTIRSARILGLGGLLGTVEAGRLAHFVVLDGNPLEDISNVARIALVVQDGRRHEPR